ncbi:MAG: hypothetical protein WD898_01220 [Candidatus Paceibacterota bacterium]
MKKDIIISSKGNRLDVLLTPETPYDREVLARLEETFEQHGGMMSLYESACASRLDVTRSDKRIESATIELPLFSRKKIKEHRKLRREASERSRQDLEEWGRIHHERLNSPG